VALQYEELKDHNFLREVVEEHRHNAVAQLQDLTGASRPLVLLRLNEAGITVPRSPVYLKLYEGEWLANQLLSGRSIVNIAEELNCSSGTVSSAMRKRGLAKKKGVPRRDMSMISCRFLKGDYEILQALAKKSGLSVVKFTEGIVHEWLESYNDLAASE
jgi:hypothetical protein